MRKRIFVCFLVLLSSSCTHGIFLMNDSEKAHYRATVGISSKEAQQLQVKHLSRDLEICIRRHGLMSLTDQDFKHLVTKRHRKVTKIDQASPCFGIFNSLVEKVGVARQNTSRKMLNQLLIEGQELGVGTSSAQQD